MYSITHLPTGRRYIGSTSNLSKRWSRHRQELRDGIHRNKHLQATWSRDGEQAFLFEVLAIVEATERIALEQRALDAFQTTDPARGFNRAAIAGVSYGGGAWERTPEWRDRQSAIQREMRPQATVGSTCRVCGAVKDGSYTKQRTGRTGRVSIQVRCQECVRKDARDRNRRKRGIPLEHPKGRHFNRRR